MIIYEHRSRKTGLNDKIFDFHFSENKIIIFFNDETEKRFKTQ